MGVCGGVHLKDSWASYWSFYWCSTNAREETSKSQPGKCLMTSILPGVKMGTKEDLDPSLHFTDFQLIFLSLILPSTS